MGLWRMFEKIFRARIGESDVCTVLAHESAHLSTLYYAVIDKYRHSPQFTSHREDWGHSKFTSLQLRFYLSLRLHQEYLLPAEMHGQTFE